MSDVRGTDDLVSFNKTWGPHSGAPKVFPYQLAVTIHSELVRMLPYMLHLDSCCRYVLMDLDEDTCDCGLVDLQRYIRRLAPFRYDAHGELLPKYEPLLDGRPPLDD